MTPPVVSTTNVLVQVMRGGIVTPSVLGMAHTVRGRGGNLKPHFVSNVAAVAGVGGCGR